MDNPLDYRHVTAIVRGLSVELREGLITEDTLADLKELTPSEKDHIKRLLDRNGYRSANDELLNVVQRRPKAFAELIASVKTTGNIDLLLKISEYLKKYFDERNKPDLLQQLELSVNRITQKHISQPAQENDTGAAGGAPLDPMELGDGGIDNAVNTPPASIKNGSGDADTLDDKDETLASATGPITQEHINFARVYNVIFTVCADALRDILQSQVPTGYTTIYKAFLGNKAMLTGMRQIRREQLQVIFPDPRFRYTGTVDQFNITLLYALIKIISSCPAPITGWGKPPTDQPRDVSLSASVERVRRIRNTVIGHSVDGKLDEKACKDYFGEISQILDDVEAVLGDKGYKGALEDHRKRVIAPRDSMVLRQQFKRLQLKEKMKALEAENEILKRALDVESRFPRLALQLLAGKWKRSQSPKAMYFSGILQIIRPQNDNLCAFDDTLITFS